MKRQKHQKEEHFQISWSSEEKKVNSAQKVLVQQVPNIILHTDYNYTNTPKSISIRMAEIKIRIAEWQQQKKVHTEFQPKGVNPTMKRAQQNPQR